VLKRQPIGIHFSGHGILNTYETVGDYHELTKDQGDFLLFETDEGDSQLVSRTQLKKLIDTTGAKLDFVFVASCHSEFVGRIFLEAGAKHVICIDQKNEVDDNAVITFTDAFYDAVFSNEANICKAFMNAQVVVSISHSPKEANIFKLLVRDSELKEPDSKQSRSKSNSQKGQGSDSKQNSASKQRGASTRDNSKTTPVTDTKSTSTITFGESSPTTSPSNSSQFPIAPPHKGSFRRRESLKQKKHICGHFGNFPKGTFKEENHNAPIL